MNKYVFISESHYDRFSRDWKYFYILTEEYTREQILSIKRALPLYYQKSQENNGGNFNIEIEGFEHPVSSDDFYEKYIDSKIIPLTTLLDFE